MTFGGHSQACGLTIREESLPLFRDRLNRASENSGENTKAAPRLADAELSPKELTMKFVKDMERMEPFGPGNPEPVFLSRGLRVKGEVRKRGKDTMQCWMTDEAGAVTCEVIGFRRYEKWRKNDPKQTSFEIVYRPALKNFNGIETMQLELQSWR